MGYEGFGRIGFLIFGVDGKCLGVMVCGFGAFVGLPCYRAVGLLGFGVDFLPSLFFK